MTKLDTQPSRLLTSRECAKMLTGTIGALADMTSRQELLAAIRWVAEHDEQIVDTVRASLGGKTAS